MLENGLDPMFLTRTENCLYYLGAQPKVHLLYATPEWVVAQATKGYTGVYSPEMISEQERRLFWEELGNTKLKGPLEMAQTFWLIEDVTRAFTHQLARYRIGCSMVQESQRFSKQTGSLAKIVVPKNIVNNPSAIESFIEGCETAMTTYFTLLGDDGVETQDARAILPTAICTRLYVNFQVNSLVHVYNQRFCCQAQNDEWSPVVTQFKDCLTYAGFNHYADCLLAPWEDPTCVSCGFGASFDRPCKHADKFQANLEALYRSKL